MTEQRTLSVAVVGPGAIGLALAASAIRKGHRVRLYGRTPQPGFRHVFEGAAHDFPHPVETDPSAAEVADWVLLATKAHQTEAAVEWLGRVSNESTVLAIVQNGVDHLERLAPHWPAARCVPVIISMPSARPNPGEVHQRRVGSMIVPDGGHGEAFADLFDDRVQIRRTKDWTTAAWTKLLTNATLGACALAVAPNGAAVQPPLKELAAALLSEIIAVGRAAGAAFDDEDELVHATLDKIAKTPEHRSSITQDRQAGRAMEWDARNQVVVRTAERFGIDVPLNRALAAMLAVADAHRGS